MASERQAANENSPWWGEHIHRYMFALRYLHAHDRVLDLACANGYGPHLLSQHPFTRVTGGDISPEAIRFCTERYGQNKNLEFRIIDGTKIPFENNYFNLITSFETIEHTTEFIKMLEEFFRTLVNGGTLILSTPNRPVNSPKGMIENPYHTQEFDFNELKALLQSRFAEVKIYGQKYIRYSHNYTFRFRMAHGIEKILYVKGVRKLPLLFQNKIMKLVIGKNMYPSADDYGMTEAYNEILRCKTFFAICKKT